MFVTLYNFGNDLQGKYTENMRIDTVKSEKSATVKSTNA